MSKIPPERLLPFAKGFVLFRCHCLVFSGGKDSGTSASFAWNIQFLYGGYLYAMRKMLLIVIAIWIAPQMIYPQEISEDIVIIDTSFADIDELFARFSGQVVYIDFWASWCKPCLEEMPSSNTLYETVKGRGITILFLAVNDREEAWRKMIQTLEIKGTHVLLTADMSRQVRQRFGLGAIPHYAILNKEGGIEYVSTLPPSYPNTANDLLQLLEP